MYTIELTNGIIKTGTCELNVNSEPEPVIINPPFINAPSNIQPLLLNTTNLSEISESETWGSSATPAPFILTSGSPLNPAYVFRTTPEIQSIGINRFNSNLTVSIVRISKSGQQSYGLVFTRNSYQPDFSAINELNCTFFVGSITGGWFLPARPAYGITTVKFTGTWAPFNGLKGKTFFALCVKRTENDSWNILKGYIPIDSYIRNFISNYTPEPVDPSPQWPGPTSGSGGADGDFEYTNNDIASTPTDLLNNSSVLNSGFISMYEITIGQLRNLAAFLWQEDIQSTFKQFFANAIQGIISLKMFPTAPTGGTISTIKIASIDTGIDANLITNQYREINYGTFTLKPYFGNFLDYSPHTEIYIYLPYIGFEKLTPEKYMNLSFTPTYIIDFISGDVICYIKAKNTILDIFHGNMSAEIALTSQDKISYMIKGFSDLSNLALTGATAYSAGGPAFAAVASIPNAINTINTMRDRQIQTLGGNSGNAGFMAPQQPFLIVTKPRQSLPSTYAHTTGYPANMSATLNQLTGFTVCSGFHLDGISATDNEKNEIARLLREGIIL